MQGFFHTVNSHYTKFKELELSEESHARNAPDVTLNSKQKVKDVPQKPQFNITNLITL